MKDSILIIDIPNIPYSSNAENIKLDDELYQLDKKWEKHFNLNNQARSNLLSYTTGLLYIASALINSDFKVEYYNYEKKGLTDLTKNLKNKTHILISSISPFFPIYNDIIKQINSANKIFKIIIGGFGPTYEPEKFLEISPQNTVAVLGGGEKKVFDAIEYFNTGILKDGLAVHNMISKKGTNCISQDEIPQPNYSILKDVKNYRINISTIRGCPGSCAFCSGVPFWKKMVSRNIDSVIQELKYLEKTLEKNTLVHFCDNVITYPEHRFIKLVKAINRQGLNLQFSCDVRADSINKETAIGLQNGQFKRICMGVEDCNNKILKHHHKGMTFEKNISALEKLREYTNSYLTAYWLIGLPGTTHKSIKENQRAIAKLIEDNLIDQVALSIFKPYPGCRFEENEILIERDWNSFLKDMDFPIYSLPNLTSMELSDAMINYKKTVINAYQRRLTKYE